MPILPATWEVEIRRIKDQGQPKQNVFETLSQLIAGGGECAPDIPAM
jgi:hypothetical protein